MKPTILFVRKGHSCRPRIAEGWGGLLPGDRFEVQSVGIDAFGLSPHAIRDMPEAHVDSRGQLSKRVSTLADVSFDLVITVCGLAKKDCPVIFLDPLGWSTTSGSTTCRN